MLQDELVEDSLHTGLSTALQGWVSTVKEKAQTLVMVIKMTALALSSGRGL